MDPITPYPPLNRAPLRMRGIFGIAWQLYKRGFWQTFLVSLLLVSLPALLMTLPQFTALSRTGFFTDMQEGISQFGKLSSLSADAELADMSAVLGSSLLVWLLSLVVRFLITPMYQGAMFLEMEERMEGRAGTLGQLFRYALPIGLKRFYTTFLSQFALEIGIGIIVAVVYLFLGVFGMMASLFSFVSYAEGGALPTPFFITIGVIVLLIILIAIVLSVFLMLIYPVAVHEKKSAFSAVGRAFKLTIKRYWRILGATLLFSLVAGVISGILCLPALLLWQNIEAMFALFAVLSAFVTGLLAPYGAAFQTALYVDTAARVDGPEISVIDPDSVPDPDPDELREGPRTL